MLAFDEDISRPDDMLDVFLNDFEALGFPCRRVSGNRVDVIPVEVVVAQRKTETVIKTVQEKKIAHVRE